MQQRLEKFYYLTVNNHCSASCRICSLYNNLNPGVRDVEGLRRALGRAVSGQYTAVVLPPNVLDYPHRQDALTLIRQFGLRPVFQVHLSCLGERSQKEFESLIWDGCDVEVVFDEYEKEHASQIQWLSGRARQIYYTFVPHAEMNAIEILRRLPAPVKQDLYFYFPLESSELVRALDPDETYSLLYRVRNEFPQVPIRPPLGVEVWDPQLPQKFVLEPTERPNYKLETEKPDIEISIIVSILDKPLYLRTVLFHLLRQNFSRDHFELVVVDAGGVNGTFDELKTLVESEVRPINIKYISMPAQPCAGPVRNLGAKHAVGKILVFLDADVLTPNQFLADVIKQHRTWDIVQYQRFHLKKPASKPDLRYKEVDLATDSYASRGSYWEKFYNENRWKALPLHWRYLRATCLSIKAQYFNQAGGFAKAFRARGFDEIFLGYKLAQLDVRWKLRKLPIYRLFPASRVGSRHSERMASAKIFFFNTLDFEFYSQFFPFLGRFYNLRMLGYLAARTRSLQLLLTPVYLVFSHLLKIKAPIQALPAENFWREFAKNQSQSKLPPISRPEREVEHEL